MGRCFRIFYDVARVLGACALAGALYGGLAIGAFWSAFWWILESRNFLSAPQNGVQDLMEGTFYALLIGAVGGIAMGFFGGLIGGGFGYIAGGVLAGFSYGAVMSFFERGSCISAAPEETAIFGFLMALTGFVLQSQITREYSRHTPARWLKNHMQNSPLENYAAWQRTLIGGALPLLFYTLVLVLITGPVFLQNRAYVSRLGFFITWRQSYYAATNSGFNRRFSCQSNLK